MINKIELKQLLKKSDKVFAWVHMLEGDGVYLQVSKGSVANSVKALTPYERAIKAELRVNDNCLYID